MKFIKATLYLIALLTTSTAAAQAYTMTFVAGDDVCTPITVRVNGEYYTVHSSLTIKGAGGSVTATDCNGRKLDYEFSHRSSNESSHDTYTFHNTYDPDYKPSHESGRSPYDNSGDGWQEVQETTERVVENTMANIGNHMSSMAEQGMMIPAAGYPNLTFNAGISRTYGEFARLKACLGAAGGYLLYGGVGKDWLFNGANKEKLAWHVGVGYYGSWGYDSEQEFNLGITFSETPVCPGYALNMDLLYNYYFGRSTRFGLFGGLGLGVGNLKEIFTSTGNELGGMFVWEVTAGIAVKLLAGD